MLVLRSSITIRSQDLHVMLVLDLPLLLDFIAL
jgi:hypothetical protein